jgi:hypothetical protein
MANVEDKGGSIAASLTPIQWLICGIAAIGFAFDIYEILMLQLIVRPALLELTGAAQGTPEYQMWWAGCSTSRHLPAESSVCSAAT